MTDVVVPEEVTPLTFINLVLAGLLLFGAIVDLWLFWRLNARDPDGQGVLRRLLVALLATVGILSVLGSVTHNDIDNILRIVLGVTRGAGVLLVWTFVISDLTRYVEERTRGGLR